ncbi:MAG: class B sortase [Eubacteriales bacterium]|nr:class B sortase [Eubacteriales bacterium]
MGPRRTKEKKRFYGKSGLIAKIAVSSVAVMSGIIFLLVFVYVIIPAVISGTADIIDQNLAIELYEKTVVTDDASQVFEQPGAAVLSPRDCFASVLADNPDIVGRISIEAQGITYLVTQADDNEHYLKTGYDGEKSNNGTIFLDYRCDADTAALEGHYIIYGHNMKDGSMFHNLMEYKNEDVFYNNRIIRFDTLYQDHEWEIFSAYVTDTNFYFIDTVFEGDSEWLDFLHEIQQKSMHETDTELVADDVVLTLCTCSYEFNNARFVIHARLID